VELADGALEGEDGCFLFLSLFDCLVLAGSAVLSFMNLPLLVSLVLWRPALELALELALETSEELELME